MIVLDLRHAITRAVVESGWDAGTEPKLRPGGQPGTYASSIALSLSTAAVNAATASTAARSTAARSTAARSPVTGNTVTGNTATGNLEALAIARTLAGRLATEDWIARATATGNGYITVTVTPQALASVAARVTAAGAGCVSSDVLRADVVAPMPPADLEGAATWEDARAALAAELAAALAVAAGATVAASEAGATVAASGGATAELTAAGGAEPTVAASEAAELAAASGGGARTRRRGPAGDAMAFAGADAVRFALARAIPGKPVRIDPVSVARYSLDNPAYAVRYAHARAVSGMRWAAALAKPGEAALPCLPADPAGWALLDALSWLPERVAVAARRGRPDELARYLEELASATIAALPFVGPAGGERLALVQATAQAARTALAAGLGLLGVAAPDRL
ncbi:MAG TPA: DALR anticodon-binding domain-containing protein [Trebonia sp.]|nr:DALR anticodon-binding domain-containing protein [Trebonia sp.]